MSENNTAISFENLYQFIDATGIVIPYTDEVKTSVENTFKEIFGADLDVSEETPVGRLIEAVTMLYVTFLGVNAQNANGFNIRTATGEYLDALGNIYGLLRGANESDSSYRNKILAGKSRGFGYVESVTNALQNIDGVTSVYVLENGKAEPAVLPNSSTGIVIDPHSLYVAVNYDDTNTEEQDSEAYDEREAEIAELENNIAKAIYGTKSAGCAYTDSNEYGTKKTVQITDETETAATDVVFYKPSAKTVTVTINVKNDLFTGTDIVATTKQTIISLFEKNGIGSTTTATEIASSVAGNGTGISVKAISMTVNGQAATEVVVSPCEYASIQDSDITVNVV